MSDKASKLFRLLVNEATSDGERSNAAAALRACMEADNISANEIQWKPYVPPPPRWSPPPRQDEQVQQWRPMPFGMHKGSPMVSLPTDYLRWIVTKLDRAKPWLIATAKAILEERGEEL